MPSFALPTLAGGFASFTEDLPSTGCEGSDSEGPKSNPPSEVSKPTSGKEDCSGTKPEASRTGKRLEGDFSFVWDVLCTGGVDEAEDPF